MSNVCLGCRYGSVKIEIFVPENYDIKKFAEQTQNFTSDIIAITKEKPMHYVLTFGSLNDRSKLDFKVHCACSLNLNQKNCAKLDNSADKDYKIRHFVYNKISTAQKIEIKSRE